MIRRDDAHADVLIIGAGPSGGAAGLRLVEAGLSVVCLEQGDWPDRSAYRGGELDSELTALKQWAWSPNVRCKPTDYRLDLSDCDEEIANFNGVGGGSTLFNAIWCRMTPRNFQSRSLAGYGSDWPLDYDELQPYYDRVDREVGISGLGGNPAYPPGGDPPLPPLPIRAGGLKVARAHAKLRWHWWPETNAILSAPYDGRHPCVARGTCDTGCGEGAKGSADLTYWRHVVAAGGKVITGARVTRIVLDGRGRAAGAEWYDKDGSGFLQTADVVLCAANGIGTPRLLLASANERFPEGLANGSGLVGKNLMLHHFAYAFATFDEPLETWFGHRGAWINSYQFYESDESRGAPGTCKWALGGAGAWPLVSVLGMGPDVWGEGHHRSLAEGFGRTLLWGLTIEDDAVESNRIELSNTHTDSAGLPIPEVHYHIPDQAKTIQAWQQPLAVESLREAGAVTVVAPDLVPVTGHLLGTARMGDDPDCSVVDRFAMSHEIPNLGILDGSVFVTSAGVNPTATITAMASRTAAKLLERRSQLPRPELPRSFTIGQRKVGPVPEPVAIEPVVLSSTEEERLTNFAEILIPPDDAHPSPRQVGIGLVLASAVLKARPDLGPALRRGLSVDGEAAAALAKLGETDAEARAAVEVVVAGGYYMSPEVWAVIGYPGQLARPSPPETYPQYIEENLLDHMLTELTE